MSRSETDITAAGRSAFWFSPGVADAGRALLALDPEQLFHRFVADKESQPVRWAARALIDAALAVALPQCDVGESLAVDADQAFKNLTAELAQARDVLQRQIGLRDDHSDAAQRAMLLERAPVRALAGVWLEGVSQPATQPDPLVNRLFSARVVDQVGRDPVPPQWLRHELALAQAGLALPGVERRQFVASCAPSQATCMLGAFYSALALYGANDLPEVVAVHWAHHMLGIDAALGGPADDALSVRDEAAACATDALRHFAARADGPTLVARMARAVRVCVRLEALQVQAVLARVHRLQSETPEQRVAQILQRHAAHAGKQHAQIRVGGKLLSDQLEADSFEPHAFMRALKASPYLQARPDGQACRFLAALEFGGPMFGIFNAEEAQTLSAWANEASPDAALAATPAAACAAAHGNSLWERIIVAARAEARFDVLDAAPQPAHGARALFHMLVNIENYPGALPLALARARDGLARAAVLLQAPSDGAAFRYTDARYFAYSREALEARLGAVYRDKLVQPFTPLASVPDADDVVFQQKTFALGNLIDGAWAYRVGLRGRHRRLADAAVFQIYADEMGGGEVRKNHIELIHRVLRSMGVLLPHIASREFIDQDELLDELYPFAIFQLSLAQFPDTLRSEILGFNLGIEMFGLGELRLHEIQKMRHWGFDTAYEVTHLSIDNFGSGHSRTSVDAVVDHLDQIAIEFGAVAQQREWERVWTGYASFAQFVEPATALPQGLSDYII